jgi:beta-RFAP synthase
MIRVTTGSRLHLGLLHVPGVDAAPGRSFGGVGLMVEAPGVRVSARPAAAWSAEGTLADRALAFAHRFARTLAPETVRPQHLMVGPGATEHVGLGTGTQLGLAVARALAVAHGRGDWGAVELARRVGRGARSALGVHSFDQGGFLVEAGKTTAEVISPLVARAAFPELWRLVLVLPPWGQGLHGPAEVRAFHFLAAEHSPPGHTETLCRLVLLGMLPALVEQDLPAFGEALREFNRRVGEAFQPVQGGTYACPRTEELVAFLRREGAVGVGQSSWGPGVFAVAGEEAIAGHWARRVRDRFGLTPAEVFTTAARNRGAVTEEGAKAAGP